MVSQYLQEKIAFHRLIRRVGQGQFEKRAGLQVQTNVLFFDPERLLPQNRYRPERT
jgi:hypothetical protein